MPLDDAEKAQILSRIERLQKLLVDLEHVSATALERAKIRDRMRQELEAARIAVRTPGRQDPT
jgi:hypothetical protein